MSFRAALFALASFAGIACNSADFVTPRPGAPDPTADASPGGEGGADGGLEPGSDDGGASIAASHAVRVLIEPSDDGAALVAAVTAAKTSVHMTMYLLTLDALTNALIARKRAGVDVKVILNQTFPQGGNANTSDFNKLKSAGVSVVWAPPGFNYTHSKVVLLDAKQAWIMTMNATATSVKDNREYLAIDDEPVDVAQAEAIFAADFDDKASQGDGPLVVSPVNSSKRLLALIASARTSLDMEAESLSDPAVVAALVAAFDRGVTLRVVLSDDFSTPGEDQAVATLKAKRIPARSLRTPYVHAKVIVADGARAYVGSVNFTTNSLSRNREMGVITDAAPEVKKVVDTIAADFGRGDAL